MDKLEGEALPRRTKTFRVFSEEEAEEVRRKHPDAMIIHRIILPCPRARLEAGVGGK